MTEKVLMPSPVPTPVAGDDAVTPCKRARGRRNRRPGSSSAEAAVSPEAPLSVTSTASLALPSHRNWSDLSEEERQRVPRLAAELAPHIAASLVPAMMADMNRKPGERMLSRHGTETPSMKARWGNFRPFFDTAWPHLSSEQRDVVGDLYRHVYYEWLANVTGFDRSALEPGKIGRPYVRLKMADIPFDDAQREAIKERLDKIPLRAIAIANYRNKRKAEKLKAERKAAREAAKAAKAAEQVAATDAVAKEPPPPPAQPTVPASPTLLRATDAMRARAPKHIPGFSR